MTSSLDVRVINAWIWYLDLPRSGSALDASAVGHDLTEQLSSYFSEVQVAPAPGTAPSTESTFDCVALHDALSDRSRASTARFEALHAVLNPEGWLVAASVNPAYPGSRGSATGLRPAVFTRMLRRAGFGEVRRLYSAPSMNRPLTHVPDTPETIAAYEASHSIQDSVKWSRRSVAKIGLSQILYPAYFIMAQK